MAGLLYCLPLTSNWLQADDKESQSTLQEAISLLNEDWQPLVLYADNGCGKTVLLFQAGVAYANQDFHVTLISRHPLTRIPLSIHGMIRPDAAGKLQTLTFLYMNKVTDLIDFCATIHTKTLIPDVLIIDDFDYYVNQLQEPGVDASCAKLCAILSDTLTYIKSKSTVGILLASCSKTHPQWRQIFNKFRFTVADITVLDHQEQQFSLAVGTDKVNMTVRYEIKKSGVYLTDLEADCIKPSVL